MDKIHAYVSSTKGFYIGDICYVLSDEVYHRFWGDRHNYEDGVLTDPESGFRFAVNRTAYGDGTYADEYGHEYPVDSGVIGLVPLELVNDMQKAHDLGVVIEKPGVACFYSEDGVFTITTPSNETHIIDTNYESDYESDYDDDYESDYEDDYESDYEDDDEEDYDEDDDF